MFATTNPHKLQEMREILGPVGVAVLGLDALSHAISEPCEDAATFAENARIKASTYARALGRPCLADDSGLEVDALGGAPGVHSARWAGGAGSRAERDAANRSKLITELRARAEGPRSARLVCTLALADARGRIRFEARGTLEGVVVDEPRGSLGFGYDAHLLLPELGKTVAELSPDERNARSHRGGAARVLSSWLARCQAL